MLILKEANYEDIEKEYYAITNIEDDENGFENHHQNCTFEEFKNKVLPTLIENSKGLNLPDGYVPGGYYFLYDDDKIIGLFKIRYFLNEYLKNGAGHVGYSILKEHRGKGYATKGLKLALELCKSLVKEDEVYFSVYKTNPASLKVLQNNGGYITHEDEEEYFVRIKKK